MSREQLFAAFFFAAFLFLLYQLYLFLAPFFAPLVWAVILALTFAPLTNRLTRLTGGRPYESAEATFAALAEECAPFGGLGYGPLGSEGQSAARAGT